MTPRSSRLIPSVSRAFGIAIAATALLATARAQGTAEIPSPTDVSKDQAVQMEAFTVTTDLGSYHEETSSMATKVPTDMKEIASSLQILNANAIGDREAKSIGDLYSYITGLTAVSIGTNAFTFRGIALGGGASPNTNVQVDGLQGNTTNKVGVSTVDIESMEFLKGPNTVLYGHMEPGGLLNIVTKSPQAQQAATLTETVSTFAGRYNNFGATNSFDTQLDVTGPIFNNKHLLYRVAMEVDSDKGFRPTDYARDFIIYPSLTYQWSPETSLTIKTEVYQHVEKPDVGLWAPNTGPGGEPILAPYNTVYNEAGDIERERGESVSALFKTRLADRWTVRVATRSVFHLDTTRALTTASATITQTVPPQNSTIKSLFLHNEQNRHINATDANIYGTLGPKNFENTVIVGVSGAIEVQPARRWDQAAVATSTPLFNSNPAVISAIPYPADGTKGVTTTTTWWDSLSGYVSDQIKIYDRLHLSLGLRAEQMNQGSYDLLGKIYVSQFLTSVTKQGGVIYDINHELSAYVSYGQSFVPNNPSRVDASGHQGFPPEVGSQDEAGLKFETPDRKLYVSLDAYHIVRSNILTATGNLTSTGLAIFRFDGEQTSNGVELETEWLPIPNWQFQAGGSIGHAYNSQSTLTPQIVGLDLANAPRQSAYFWSRYNVPHGIFRGLGASLGGAYSSRQWIGDPTSLPTFMFMPGYTRVDTGLYYKWTRWDFSVIVKNVLDRKYLISDQTNSQQIKPGDPRAFVFTCALHF